MAAWGSCNGEKVRRRGRRLYTFSQKARLSFYSGVDAKNNGVKSVNPSRNHPIQTRRPLSRAPPFRLSRLSERAYLCPALSK